MPEANSDSNNPVNPPGPESKKEPKPSTLRIAGALSAVLWIAGFILPFVLKSDSPYVFVSDTCLLCGFWPLLFYYRAGWTWFIFGILNMSIGFGLEIACHLVVGPEVWTPERMQFKAGFEQLRKHVIEMHPSEPWLAIGLLSTVYGAFRMVKHAILWIIKKSFRT